MLLNGDITAASKVLSCTSCFMTGTDMTVNSVISIRAYRADILRSHQIAGLDFNFDARRCR
jgi:hypothetical protein